MNASLTFNRRLASTKWEKARMVQIVRSQSSSNVRSNEGGVKKEYRMLEDQLTQLSMSLDSNFERALIEEKALSKVETEEVVKEDPKTASETEEIVKEDPKTASPKTEFKGSESTSFVIKTFKSKSSPSFFSRRSFKHVNLSEELIKALETIGIQKPSQIQGLALEAFKDYGMQRSLLLADQAGSGKTLAYLLPLIQKLRFEEEQIGRKLTKPSQPRALIVVPTAELTVQVMQLCRSIAKTCKFRSAAFTGGHPVNTQTRFLQEGVDVAVCTPNRLLSLLKADKMRLDVCQTIVLDEIDILLGEDSDFRESVLGVLQYVKEGTQFLLATATLPGHTFTYLSELFRDLTVVLGPGLHRTAPGVIEQLVDASGGDAINEETGQKRKADALFYLIQKNEGPSKRTVVFCNKIETCRKVENFLKRKDRSETKRLVLAYHSAIDASTRSKNLKTFLKASEERHVILISTDRASRGLDTANVSHVILFDFPRDPSEYVRRVGRTARGANGEGLVSVIVLGRQVKQAMNVLTRSKKGMPIHRIPEQDDA